MTKLCGFALSLFYVPVISTTGRNEMQKLVPIRVIRGKRKILFNQSNLWQKEKA
jgi:hypothetical protein